MNKSIAMAGMMMCAALAACDDLPRDPAQTSDRVKVSRRFTVALADRDLRTDAMARRLIGEVERRSGARAHWTTGTEEALFRQLDEGGTDIVIGRFRADSPWTTGVAFAPALTTYGKGKDRLELKAAMRNGENRWIMTVERASRAVSAEARKQ